MRALTKRLIGGVAALAAAAPAFSQCAMCRTAIAAQGAETANTLNFAILILLLPAMGMFCGVYFYAYKHRADEQDEENQRWGK